MLRGCYSCACSIHAKPSSTPFSPYRFLYRFRPSFNCTSFLHFPTRTDSRTDPSSYHPLSPPPLLAPYRKTGVGGRGTNLLANIRVPNCESLRPRSFHRAGHCNRDERNALNLELSTLNLELHFPLSPTIPAHTVHLPATPIIPALTQNGGGGESNQSPILK